MMEPVDFTRCERLPGRAYNGANGEFIDDVPLLSELQRRFDKTYLAARREALFGAA